MDTPATDTNDIGEKLEVFVRAYVTEFEEKLVKYAEEAAVDVRDKTAYGKSNLLAIFGHFVAIVGVAVAASAVLVGGPMASIIGLVIGVFVSLISSPINVSENTSARKHKEKAKKITQIFQQLKSSERKEIFVEAAGLIFYSLQRRVIYFKDEEDVWRRDLTELAIEACNRSISHIYNEEEMSVNAALSRDYLTKASIKGNSKESYIPNTNKSNFVRIEHIVDRNNEKLDMVKVLQKMRIEDIMLVKHAFNEVSPEIAKHNRILARKKISREFKGSKHQLAELYDKIKMERKEVLVSQCASISGESEYATSNRQLYENVLWIDAKVQSSARNAFHTLGEKLKISCEKGFYCMVEDIYKYFSKSKSLFIFDNVNNFENIKNFLPSNLSPTDEKPAIIIISSNFNFEIGNKANVNVIKLEELSPEKALRFLNKVLDIKDEEKSDDNSIPKLSKQLSFFPLAFCQVVSEIKSKGSLDSAIKIYLVEFCDEKKKRLSVVRESKRDRFTETAYITWQITLRNIERNEVNGRLAIRLVEIMAYLAADDIPLKALTNLAGNDRMKEGIDILLKFSLITVEDNVAQIHRHDQQIIRMWLQDNEREEEVLRMALTQVHDNVDVKHRAALWSYACEYTTLIDNYFSKMDEESIAYPEFLDALNYIVTDGDVFTIAKLFNHIERNDLGRKLICTISKGYSLNCRNMTNTDQKMYVKFVYLFHAEVYNALKHSNSYDLVRFLQSFVFIFFHKTLINSWFDDDTALHKSVRRGNLDVVKILIENGADVNCVSRFEESPLYVALRAKNLELAQYLLDQGADSQKVDHTIGWKAIHYAAYYGNLNLMQRLGKTKEEYETRTEVDWTPLHFAALNDHVEIVKFLINHRVDPNAVTEEGQTVCHIAAERGAIRVFKYLIDNSLVDVNVRTVTKETLLNTAVRYGQFDIVKYLVSDETHSKADINTFDEWGVTPLFQAVLRRHDKIAKFLIEHGAVIDNGRNGNTLLGQFNISPLHLAAAIDSLHIVRILIEITNDDINMGLNTSFSPLQVAKYFDSTQVCEFLINSGADTSEWREDNLENIRRIFRYFYKDINEYDAISYILNEFNFILCMDVPYENNDNFREGLKKICCCLEELKGQVGAYQK